MYASSSGSGRHSRTRTSNTMSMGLALRTEDQPCRKRNPPVAVPPVRLLLSIVRVPNCTVHCACIALSRGDGGGPGS